MPILIFYFILLGQSVSDNQFIGYEATSMAGATVANPGTIESIFNNPSGILEANNKSISFGGGNLYGLSWLSTYYASAIFKLPIFGTIGIGTHSLNVSYMGTDLSKENSIIISNASYLIKDRNSSMSFGWSINRMSWATGKSAGISGDGSDGESAQEINTYGLNIGMHAALNKTYRMGVYLRNINSPIIGKGLSQQELSRRLDIGIAYVPFQNTLTSLTYTQQLGLTGVKISGGFQYKINNFMKFQLGAQSNPNRFGFGLEGNYKSLTFLYSFLSHPVLPSTNQFGLRYNF